MTCLSRTVLLLALVVPSSACGDFSLFEGSDPWTDTGSTDAAGADPTADAGADTDVGPRRPAPDYEDIHAFANGCYTMDGAAPDSARASFLVSTGEQGGFPFDDDETGYAFAADEAASAARLYMKPSGLGTYIFFDEQRQYVVGRNDGLERKKEVRSDIHTLDDGYKPGVQWKLEVSVHDESRFQLLNLRTGKYLAVDGMARTPENAAVITLYPADGCTEYPELGVHATGEPKARKWEDGSVWGFVETHTHIMSNLSFGGAGMFHGAPFDPLGVRHALPSCQMFHGFQGHKDVIGYGFDRAASEDRDRDDVLGALLSGKTDNPQHATAGYPEFTDWPNAHTSSTHQVQYYKWLKRAYLSGQRLTVQLATSNEIICQLLEGSGTQPTRYSCNEMVAVDRILEATRQMERYIDAQNGGPGEGWFRIVETPEEARRVIDDGKMAVVLGIEVSNLFDCYLHPPEGKETCDKQDVVEKLDTYYDKGVRTVFPVHKYDNAFSAGDGHRGFIELGNFAQTGHHSNFVKDCPDVPAVFDDGGVKFGDLNAPRDDYDRAPPVDMSDFSENPVRTLLDHPDKLTGEPLEGDYCMNHGLTDLGRFLIKEMTKRGMLVEVDHLPRRSYQQAFEILEKRDYPAVASHGSTYDGKIYDLGGVSKFDFGNCADPDDPGARADDLNRRVAMRKDAGVYPGEGFGFDLNGLAGAPGPRFGQDSVCDKPQENPVEYPFDSYAGNITFTEPNIGERTLDFNSEGLVHVGLIPELIQDVQNTGVTKDELEPLFKSAESYLRMWEKARRRAEHISE